MQRLLPLDRFALLIMGGLAVVIALLIALGDHTVPQIDSFSWNQESLGAEDRAFIMTFNRPMEWDEVESNLAIEPPLPGKLSWSGRRLAYTLESPIPYGQNFKLTLDQVRERQRGSSHRPKVMRPFEATFQSREKAFVYLGTNSEESGRLVLYRMTQETKTILTPKNLEILDFQPFPDGDRILFSATNLETTLDGSLDPDLYIVSTGIDNQADKTEEAMVPKKIFGDKNTQLLKFSLAPDGSQVVFQQATRSQEGALGEVTLWQLPIDGRPSLLKTESGGDFQIAPDGQTLVMARGQGLAVIPLDRNFESEPLDYLPEFGNLLSFSIDGSAAAMVKFNNDFTRSLFLVTNQGQQEELVRLKGGILSAQFNAQKTKLYCLLTRVTEESDNKEDYEEKPYFAELDLATRELKPLLDLPLQPNLEMSLAPDASSILFDQVLETPGAIGDSTTLISVSNLWQLSLNSNSQTPAVPIKVTSGATPKWLP